MTPSKELLSIVLGERVVRVNILNELVYFYYEGNRQEYFINIYELTHRVKEWVYTTGVTNFLSGQADHGRKCEFYNGFDEIVLYADTEPEAILKPENGY